MRSLLTQAYAGGLHVIVVDDHSSDRTAAIAVEAGVTVVSAGPLPAAVWTESITGALNQSVAVWEMSPVFTVLEHREGGGGMHDLREPQLLAVEGDRGVDVMDEVTDADTGHGCIIARMARPAR